MEPIYLGVIGLARTTFFVQGLKFRIRGTDNIPATGGAVVAINHTGFMDFTYAGLAARPRRRLIRFMAKQSVFTNTMSGPLMRGMKHIPVDRSSGATSFRRAVTDLKAGELVGVFPEATISRSFEPMEFKSGAVRMAQAAGVPILPMTIWGSQRVWTKDHPKRMGRTNTPIFITIGPAIACPKGQNAEALTADLRAAMTAQLHADQEEYPPMLGDERVYLPARLGGTAPSPSEAEPLDEADKTARRDGFGSAS